jgi:hypothetical protein
MNSELRVFFVWLASCLAVGVLVLVLVASRSPAAPGDLPAYKTLEAVINPKNLERKGAEGRKLEQRIYPILGNNQPYIGNEVFFEEFYTKYFFPKWTLTTEENLSRLGEQRSEFVRRHLEYSSRNPQAHDKLVDLTFKFTSAVVADPGFHPAVRYHCAMVLGALNSREAERTGARSNPEPYSPALPVLVAQFRQADNVDALRIAALLGILRHLEWDNFRPAAGRIPPPEKDAIVRDLLALAQSKTPPAGRSQEGHLWMRRRAVVGLTYAGFATTSPEICTVLADLVKDEAEPVALRCTAADALGRFNYEPAATVDPKATALELGYLALVACDAELQRLDALEQRDEQRAKVRTRGFSGMMPGSMMPGGMMPGGDAGGVPLPGESDAGGVPDGMMPGGVMPGGMTPGGMTPGGMTPGGMTPGGMTPGGMMPGGMMPGKGSKGKGKSSAATATLGKSDAGTQRIEFLRRRLRYWLFTVQWGLGDPNANEFNKSERTLVGGKPTTNTTYTRGIAAPAQKAAQKPDDLKYVESVIAQVQALIKVLETPDQDREELERNLRKEMKALEGITRALAPPKTEPAEPMGTAPVASAPSAPPAPGGEVPMGEVPTAPMTPSAPAAPTATAGDGKAAPPTAPAGEVPVAAPGAGKTR